MKLTYREQLLHPNWQRKRLERLQESDWSCDMCGCKDESLHVHHKRYVKGRFAWEYDLQELATLCATCHADQHQLRELLDEVLALCTGHDPLRTCVGLVTGYLTAAYDLDPEIEQRVRGVVGGVWVDEGVAGYALGTASRKTAASALQKLATGRDDPVFLGLMQRWRSTDEPGEHE